MISLFSGTPGSGKSLAVAELIVTKIESGRDVIGNMIVDLSSVYEKNDKKKKPERLGKYIYFENSKINKEFLMNYAINNHKKGREGQTVVIFDECQMVFHPSVIALRCKEDKDYRVQWLDFFSQHRHLGFDIVLVTQFDKLIDAQIRCLIEYNLIHRKINNAMNLFTLILTILNIKMFSQVRYWYLGGKRPERIDGRTFFFKKKFCKIYDSYARWDELIKDAQLTADSEALGSGQLCVLDDEGQSCNTPHERADEKPAIRSKSNCFSKLNLFVKQSFDEKKELIN